VQIITGNHDPGVLPVNAAYLHERLPHSKSHKIDAGHTREMKSAFGGQAH